MTNQNQNLSIEKVIRRRGNNVLIWQEYTSFALRLLAFVLVMWFMLTQVFMIYQVSGNNMFPGLKDGDVVFAYRLEQDFAKNDVVIYHTEDGYTTGRILGRPRDVIILDDSGNLLVNGTNQAGEILYPTYAKDGIEYPYVVPEDSYFLLGDYRTQTIDSRDFGSVTKEDMVGKAITILRRRGI